MKNIYRGAFILAIALTGCATNKAPSAQTVSELPQAASESSKKNSALQPQIDAIQKQIASCVSEVNHTDDAKYVNEHILVLTQNNPEAKALNNSSAKITQAQAVVLKRFKESTLKCRSISNELPLPALVEVYTNFYTKIDGVYADLLDKRIAIGVANQERAMRIQYAKSRWAEVMKTQKGG